MANVWLVSAVGLAAGSLLYAWLVSPTRFLRARARARLHQLEHRGDGEGGSSAIAGFLFWLIQRPLVASDFRELEDALEASGKSPLQARQYYLLVCWLVPLGLLVVVALLFDAMAGVIAFILAFLLTRRSVRSAGRAAERQQNREAIELCYMTRMLMEAGLTPERALRLIARQGRTLMPLLIRRIDRFNRVMESGADRSRALDELGQNRNIRVLRSYVSLMKQAGTLGTGVAQGLDQIIDEAHHEARSKLKEETNRVAAHMTIIMIVFMLPALFILVGGPAVLTILDALQR